ncbi:helix-turn-helix domain-containing protein [Kitasatospora sp. NPDC004669]|uniref:helix-turn-helix transcriptional regulator n=1 Tax=Kitasatospora sp. NPDC004669 TaxID=3154555 RepID=UPI0033A368D3
MALQRQPSAESPDGVPIGAGAAPNHARPSEREVDLLHSGWYSTEELAALLGLDPSTLRRWRTATPPQGPPFVRLANRSILYSIPDTQTWLMSQRINPMAQEAL